MLFEGRQVHSWGLRLPWAHPIWPEYLIMLYDLQKRDGDAPMHIYLEGATHEFLIHALDPKVPLNFNRSMFKQKKLSPLQPANLGYQFIAESDQAAMQRLNKLVEEMLNGRMSPDTDFRPAWDEVFKDGQSLLKSALEGLAPEPGAVVH